MTKFIVKEDIKRFVDENPSLVSRKETSIPGVFVLKYKRKVFYDNLWNDYLEECRGTIIDADYNIISRPFTKIYNYGVESKAPVLDDTTMLDVYRKVNGFMVAVTWYNDDILISTTGSIDSEFVTMARELINPAVFRPVCKTWNGYTLLFECVHPTDPHIIKEKVGMYLIGYRENTWNSVVHIEPDTLKLLAVQLLVRTVEHCRMSLGGMKRIVKNVTHEGFVAYTDHGTQAFKIKSPYYLVTKFVARNPNTDKLLLPNVKEKVDEEYYPLIDHIQANIEGFTAMDEQSRISWVKSFLD